VLTVLSLLLGLGAAAVGCAPKPKATTPPAVEASPHPAEPVAEAEIELPQSQGFPEWMVTASRKITEHAKAKAPRAWDRMALVADTYGPRLSGSAALDKAIFWAMTTMASDGLENARREEVMVPHWQRGRESVQVVAPVQRELVMLGLGGSVGTRNRPLRARIAVVSHVDEIAKAGAELKGKIVVINQVMPPFDLEHHDSGYGEAVEARSRGAIEAAKKGAKAVLIRSVTARSLRTPHTGAMNYESGVSKIPAAALTVEDIEFLVRTAKRGPVTVELRMGAKTLKDAPSANVIAELPGRENRDEVVLIGGHLDSWDVGDGSTDDLSGCVMAMEAALMLKELGLIPRRTIRVVLFTNEENGLRGAKAYAEEHGDEVHVAAIEADSGAAAPLGFGVAGTDEQVTGLATWGPLFLDLGASTITKGWMGADLGPLAAKTEMLAVTLMPDGSTYFDVHHSPADTVEKIDPGHLQRNAAAMALMAYLLAEQP
jgi:hypothetical protein